MQIGKTGMSLPYDARRSVETMYAFDIPHTILSGGTIETIPYIAGEGSLNIVLVNKLNAAQAVSVSLLVGAAYVQLSSWNMGVGDVEVFNLGAIAEDVFVVCSPGGATAGNFYVRGTRSSK